MVVQPHASACQPDSRHELFQEIPKHYQLSDEGRLKTTPRYSWPWAWSQVFRLYQIGGQKITLRVQPGHHSIRSTVTRWSVGRPRPHTASTYQHLVGLRRRKVSAPKEKVHPRGAWLWYPNSSESLQFNRRCSHYNHWWSRPRILCIPSAMWTSPDLQQSIYLLHLGEFQTNRARLKHWIRH
jgi:hypothetical protein